MSFENAEEILEFHLDWIKEEIGKGENIPPCLFISRDNEVIPITFSGDENIRLVIRQYIEKVKKTKLDWAIFITTGYMKMMDKENEEEFEENYEYGDLSEENPKETQIIQVFTPEKKLLGIYDKDTLEEIGKSEDISGFLSF